MIEVSVFRYPEENEKTALQFVFDYHEKGDGRETDWVELTESWFIKDESALKLPFGETCAYEIGDLAADAIVKGRREVQYKLDRAEIAKRQFQRAKSYA